MSHKSRSVTRSKSAVTASVESHNAVPSPVSFAHASSSSPQSIRSRGLRLQAFRTQACRVDSLAPESEQIGKRMLALHFHVGLDSTFVMRPTPLRSLLSARTVALFVSTQLDGFGPALIASAMKKNSTVRRGSADGYSSTQVWQSKPSDDSGIHWSSTGSGASEDSCH